MEDLPLQTYKEQTLAEILADPPVLSTDLRWSTTSHEMVRISAQSGRLIFDPEGMTSPTLAVRYGTQFEIISNPPTDHEICFATDTKEIVKNSPYSGDLLFIKESNVSPSGVTGAFDFDATVEGQTVFSVVSYIEGKVDVFVNGSKLRDTMFEATDGVNIVLGSGVSVGAWVQVVVK